MEPRPGCLAGILKFLMLGWLFDWLQDTFGFGRGASCTGCFCGLLLVLVFLCLLFSVFTGTNWFRLVFELTSTTL